MGQHRIDVNPLFKAKSLKAWEAYLVNEKRNISHWDRLIEKHGFARAWDWGADWLACIAECKSYPFRVAGYAISRWCRG